MFTAPPSSEEAGAVKSDKIEWRKRKSSPNSAKKAAARPSRLFIRVFENNEKNPTQTVTIPLGVLKLARSLIPNRARAALEKEGIDIDQVMGLADQREAPGVLLEVEDHKKKKKVVISIE